MYITRLSSNEIF